MVAYVVFLGSFLYAIGFVANVVVPKGIDDGPVGDVTAALLINAGLLGLFAVQHSIMARPWFKRVWTKIVPHSAERSTFVLLASLILVFLYWQWRPMPEPVWQVENQTAAYLLWGLSGFGWLMVLLSTFLINHFDLFGLRQVTLNMQKREYTPLHFKLKFLYRMVRHPLMLGFLIAFWATPTMSQGHLLFAVATTAYILLAIQFEERDLVAMHGKEYLQYRESVSMILPIPKKG
jgi:protein-S-isoprenylcysteine O-methyltransferase Ste14